VIPETETRFRRAVCPETISTSDRETLKVLEKNRMSSSFAAPSTGGDVSLIFNAPSYSPTISDFDDRGITRTENTIRSFDSVNLIIVLSVPPPQMAMSTTLVLQVRG